MELVTPWKLGRIAVSSFCPTHQAVSGFSTSSRRNRECPFPLWAYPSPFKPGKPLSVVHAKKRPSRSEPVLKPTIVQEVSLNDDEEEEGDDDDEEAEALFDELDDDELVDGYDDEIFEDEYLEDDSEVSVGDGGAGGGISLAGSWWDKAALAIAEEVSLSFDGDLKLYAFKTLLNSTIQVRIEKLSTRSGSPSMEDIEAFSATYRARLDEAEAAKSVPENLSLEVSSPGIERVVRVPHDFDRFRDRPMFVKYVNVTDPSGSSSGSDGVFKLVSVDMEMKCCTWGLADVRINREKAGKGRPLSKKQREWQLTTSFDSLHLVRIYSDM